MTIQQLNIELSNEMRSFIRERDHIITGALLNSIKFKCTYSNGKLNINFKTMFYIKYLEDGGFVNEFFTLRSVKDLTGTFLATEVRDEFFEDISMDEIFKK